MIRQLAFAVSILAAGPASALSCIPSTVAGAYQDAANSPVDYVIGVGSLSLTGPSNPPEGAVALGGDINNMVGYTQPANFSGGFFTGNGFGNGSQAPVTVDVGCTIAWCGSASNVDYGLFFFEVVNGAYVLHENACPGFAFQDAHPGMLQEVILCHQGTCPGAW